MKKINKKINKKGFSLVEVLISMTILVFGLGAVSILMVRNIRTIGEAKNQTIAVGLAEEGLELVRNFKENVPTFKSSPVVKANGDYVVDINSSFALFANSANKQLYLPAAGGLYVRTSAGNVATNFFRKITLENVAGAINVTSYVSWKDGNFAGTCTVANKCISVKTTLLD